MKLRLFVFTAVFLTWANVARAETAEEMLAGCRLVANAPVRDQRVEIPNDADAYSCWGAMAVIQDLSRLTHESKPVLPFGSCATERSTRTQLAAVFVAYLEKHPEHRDKRFSLVALWAIDAAFPCRKQ